MLDLPVCRPQDLFNSDLLDLFNSDLLDLYNSDMLDLEIGGISFSVRPLRRSVVSARCCYVAYVVTLYVLAPLAPIGPYSAL